MTGVRAQERVASLPLLHELQVAEGKMCASFFFFSSFPKRERETLRGGRAGRFVIKAASSRSRMEHTSAAAHFSV